jgi:hypothetical protein
MGSFDALTNKANIIPGTLGVVHVPLTFKRPGRTYATPGSAYPTDSTVVVITLVGVVGQKKKKAVPYTVGAAGTETPEPDKIVLIIYFTDNPGATFQDANGGFIIQTGDIVTAPTTPISAIVGQSVTVEQVRTYPDCLQIDALFGTNAQNI